MGGKLTEIYNIRSLKFTVEHEKDSSIPYLDMELKIKITSISKNVLLPYYINYNEQGFSWRNNKEKIKQ